MKYIKHINELKSDTYKNAGDKLLKYGHLTRGQKLASYGGAMRAEEIKKMVADAELNLESDIIKLEDELKSKSLCSNSFKLKITPPVPNESEEYKSRINSLINNNFYLTGFVCPQLDYGITEYIDNDWLGIEFIPSFSYVNIIEKPLAPNPMWSNEKLPTTKVAEIKIVEPFKVGISLIQNISQFVDDHNGLGSEDIENKLYLKSKSYIEETYNDFLGVEVLYKLTNRQDARLVVNAIKKAFDDDSKIFKDLYKMFKDQQGENFDYHAALSAFQRAVSNKISLNLLYSE